MATMQYRHKVLEESVEIIAKPTENDKKEFLAKYNKGISKTSKKVEDDDDSDGELDID